MNERDDIYRFSLFRQANSHLFRFAKHLRDQNTEAEKILWSRLRNRKLNGKKFRRQHPVDERIVDFYCHECNLVIELDGEGHKDVYNKADDENRTEELNRRQLRVIRFWNAEVLENIENVLNRIRRFLY